jgi:formylglycine-generating enzyme
VQRASLGLLVRRQPKGMVWIPGGDFLMGSDEFYPEERPVRRMWVEGFWMDQHPVTNADYRRFVQATGHVTSAEIAPDPADHPDADPHLLRAGSWVFHMTSGPVDLNEPTNWWSWVPGADWRRPKGPGDTLHGRDRYPVVHVAYADALAYAEWAGKELPTEAQWEFAARGGLERARFVWGDDFAPRGRMMANTWQGQFPWQNLVLDGYMGTSPVGSFPPNGYGLSDMAGNVWEWTSDYFSFHTDGVGRSPSLPHSPRVETLKQSRSPHLPGGRIPRKVIKGGSHLCAPNYSLRYRPAARQGESVDTSTGHIGFRCILRADDPLR